jgi:hypothetical protein
MNAMVAICVVFVPTVAVGAIGVQANGIFKISLVDRKSNGSSVERF